MYYTLYKDIRQLIADATGIKLDSNGRVKSASDVLQDIQWFNNQYDGIVHLSPVVFVEFQPLEISLATKQNNSTEIDIRLHVVTEVMNESDNDVGDEEIMSHEDLAEKVCDAVDGQKLTFMNTTTRRLQLTGWTHYHKYNGFMVTLIDLKTKG